MRVALLAALACVATPAWGATGDVAGAWTVDLRPSDSAPAYTQPMELRIAADGVVTGSFYGSAIGAGRAVTARGRTCVAFRTSDGRGPYQHAACLEGARMVGTSWAEHRQFVLPWIAER